MTPELSPADVLDLPSATSPERLVMSRGNLFSVTARDGNIAPAGARELGVFHQDTRHLSYYELALPSGTPTQLSSENVSAVATQIDLTATDREFGGFLDEPVNFLHVRRKQILDDDFVDHLVFTNHLDHDVELEFELRFGADFADVFEVRGARRGRRGEYLPPVVDQGRLELRYRGVDGRTYRTVIRFSPEAHFVEPSRARFRMTLTPGEAQIQEVVVSAFCGDEPERPRWPFDVRLARSQGELTDFTRAGSHARADNLIVMRTFERALADVVSLRILHDGRWIVGAGIPWFAAPFGRDALITSCQTLCAAPALAIESLRFLGAYQGRTSDEDREEEPGKIMHELRRGEMARAGEIPHSPYYGSVDATPLYVILAAEAHRWLADDAFLGSIWPNVLAAMEWLERQTEGGTRLVTYQRRTPRGLLNQGWKDSRDGVSYPDGRRAVPPIALVEVQGYAIDAFRCAAWLAGLRGEKEQAATWRARAESMSELLERGFWCQETRFYALAIDRDGRQVPTLSSNPGHLLWSRAITPERARRVTEVLLGPEMYSGWGIRTVGRGQTVFNPISYHNGTVWPHDNAIAALGMARYGLGDAALKVMDAMLAAADQFRYNRLPELFCGMGRGDREFLVQYPVSCSPQAWASGALFMLLQATLGLEPDGTRSRLVIHNPRLPRTIRRLEILSMRVGNARVSLRFERSGRRTHVDVMGVRGGPLRVDIEIE